MQTQFVTIKQRKS